MRRSAGGDGGGRRLAGARSGGAIWSAIATAVVPTGAAAALLTACLPGYTFGGSGAGEGGSDAARASDARPGADASRDAPREASRSGDATVEAAVDAGHDASSVDATTDGHRDAVVDGGRGAPEAAVDGGRDASTRDAPGDAQVDTGAGPLGPLDGGVTPFAIVSGSGVTPYSIGYGEQLHLIYAKNDHAYWLFYFDAATPGAFAATWSPDLVTWSSPTHLALPPNDTLADGYSFSVAYVADGTTDAVHIVADTRVSGSGYQAVHVRATLSGHAVAQLSSVSLPSATNGASCYNDGPTTLVTASGTVYDVTAWADHTSLGTNCDTDIFRSSVNEPAWSGTTTFSEVGYFPSVPGYAYSHDLVALPDAGSVLAVFPDQDTDGETNFASMGTALSGKFPASEPNGTYLDASAEPFAASNSYASYNDWSVWRLADKNVHVVRHAFPSGGSTPDAFEEVIFDGQAWTPVPVPPPAVPSPDNSGVVLLGDCNPAHGMLLVTLDTSSALQIAKSPAPGAWSTRNLVVPGSNRLQVAGGGCVNGKAILLFTQGTASAYSILGADLTSLL